MFSKRSDFLRGKRKDRFVTLERLETALDETLRIILLVRPEDGKKLVPIAQRLEQELQALRNSEDDYDRYKRMAGQR